MRRVAGIFVTLLAAVGLIGGADLSHQRQIPVNSSTAVSISTSNTRSNTLQGADSTTVFQLDAAATATDDIYNGLRIQLSGTSCPDSDYDGVVTDYVGSTLKVTVSPAASPQPDATCTFTLGPGLKSQMRELTFGGCTGTCYYSFRSAGTSSTDYFTLLGGQYRTIIEPHKLWYIEFLSVSATDTMTVEWN